MQLTAWRHIVREPSQVRSVVISVLLSVMLIGNAYSEEFVTLTPDEIPWVDVGSNGMRIAYLAGNPNAEGLYVMRIRFPAGMFSQPHSHDQDRFVTVIEGVWYAGTQAEFDKDNTVALPAGSFMKHPAGRIHYDGAKETAVIVEIRGMGPVVTTSAM
ncbi:MAG: cupin domain-containing protein [Gammaproteobacteria bacterium]|nr:cupin domain-containing protein [Gammaproteobacteria bacterium]